MNSTLIVASSSNLDPSQLAHDCVHLLSHGQGKEFGEVKLITHPQHAGKHRFRLARTNFKTWLYGKEQFLPHIEDC